MATRYALLLRGINVGRHRQLPMADLKAALAGLGYDDVATIGRSGNVVCTASGTAARVEEEVAHVIASECGVDGVAIVARTAAQLAGVVDGLPWPERAGDGRLLHVAFLSGAPGAGARRAVEAAVRGEEEVAFAGRELYAWYADGMNGSTLARTVTDKTLGVTVTDRNWNTVVKLHQLACG